MATTTNFGWETPDDTDLVKDGALAIRTLGSAIDTSLVDLKGGTTGQVLSKTSNTDMDFTWVAQDDSNAIQNAIVDAKGDLITATAADTPARLEVGTNGQILTADSTTATGLKWATPASSTPTFVGCRLRSNTAQNLTNNVATAINFQVEDFDTDGFHSTTTNNTRITIPSGKAGYYLFTGHGEIQDNTTGTRYTAIYKNGVLADIATSPGGPGRANVVVVSILSASVGDYFELYLQQNSGSTLVTYDGTHSTTFSAEYLGA